MGIVPSARRVGGWNELGLQQGGVLDEGPGRRRWERSLKTSRMRLTANERSTELVMRFSELLGVEVCLVLLLNLGSELGHGRGAEGLGVLAAELEVGDGQHHGWVEAVLLSFGVADALVACAQGVLLGDRVGLMLSRWQAKAMRCWFLWICVMEWCRSFMAWRRVEPRGMATMKW